MPGMDYGPFIGLRTRTQFRRRRMGGPFWVGASLFVIGGAFQIRIPFCRVTLIQSDFVSNKKDKKRFL